MGDKIIEMDMGLEMELVESEIVDWPMALSYFTALLPIYCYPVWASFSLDLLNHMRLIIR